MTEGLHVDTLLRERFGELATEVLCKRCGDPLHANAAGLYVHGHPTDCIPTVDISEVAR